MNLKRPLTLHQLGLVTSRFNLVLLAIALGLAGTAGVLTSAARADESPDRATPDWYLKAVNVQPQVGETRTSFYVDGTAELIARDPEGNEIAHEIQKLTDERAQHLRELAAASQTGPWKTDSLCPGAPPSECSTPERTKIDTRLSNGRVETVIDIDGINSKVRYRDNPAVLELREILSEDPEGRRPLTSPPPSIPPGPESSPANPSPPATALAPPPSLPLP